MHDDTHWYCAGIRLHSWHNVDCHRRRCIGLQCKQYKECWNDWHTVACFGSCRAFLDKAVAADGIGCASLMQSPAGLRSWPPSLVGSEPTGTGSSNSYLASQLSRIHFDLH